MRSTSSDVMWATASWSDSAAASSTASPSSAAGNRHEPSGETYARCAVYCGLSARMSRHAPAYNRDRSAWNSSTAEPTRCRTEVVGASTSVAALFDQLADVEIDLGPASATAE